MRTGEEWLNKWIQKKIVYYERFLQNNPECKYAKQIEEGIKILREML